MNTILFKINEYNNKLNELFENNDISVYSALGLQELNILENKIKLNPNNTKYQEDLNHYIDYSTNLINSRLNKKIEKNKDDLKSFLEKESIPYLLLKFNLQNDLKQVMISSEKNLTHIPKISPEELRSGYLMPSKNRENMYITEIGNFLFASSEDLESNSYLSRCGNGSMKGFGTIEILENCNNLEIKNEKLLLKNPANIYELNPENFTPQIKIILDKNSPKFIFNNEWTCNKPLNIHNQNEVLSCSQINDITHLLNHYQIYVPVNKSFPYNQFNQKNVSELISKGLKEKSLVSLNKEVNKTMTNDKVL